MDWRLTNQRNYLTGVSLTRRTWDSAFQASDHEHCAFCWAKFAAPRVPQAVQAGYATLDGLHWVCDTCFQDFRGAFGWCVV